jgi:molybdopterin molybdotransferase
MTGAPIPSGFDAVYPIETVQRQGDTILIDAPSDRGAHIRRRGEDFSAGEIFLRPGMRIGAGAIAALASAGCASVEVVRRPRVLHFATGSELIEDVGAALAPGRIRNSNAPFLQAALQAMQIDAVYGGQVRDEPEVFLAALRAELEREQPDLVLTTGAVSAGDFDFIPQVIASLGGEILFHKTTIKPGKPILFARLPNGRFFFGLPGNPVSTAVGLRFFVTPLLRALQGLPPEAFERAVLRGELRKPRADWRFFIKAQRSSDAQGLQQIAAHGGQESHKIKPLVDSNAWLILDEGRTVFGDGETVLCCPFLDTV